MKSIITHATTLVIGIALGAFFVGNTKLAPIHQTKNTLPTDTASTTLDEAKPLAQKSRLDNSAESNALTPSANDALETLLTDGQQSLSAGDIEGAMKAYNTALLQAATDAEKEAAIDGIIAVHQQIYSFLSSDKNQMHNALWQLHEMYKLKPSDTLRYDIQNLSQEILINAQQLELAGDTLTQADQIGTLMHLTRMLNYEVADANGARYDHTTLGSEFKTLQAAPGYSEQLQQRASSKLSTGSAIDKNFVFWDYTQLSELKGEAGWEDPKFTHEFTEATILHLTHLQDVNELGDLQSRMDFIRYVYPKLMSDPRVQAFSSVAAH